MGRFRCLCASLHSPRELISRQRGAVPPRPGPQRRRGDRHAPAPRLRGPARRRGAGRAQPSAPDSYGGRRGGARRELPGAGTEPRRSSGQRRRDRGRPLRDRRRAVALPPAVIRRGARRARPRRRILPRPKAHGPRRRPSRICVRPHRPVDPVHVDLQRLLAGRATCVGERWPAGHCSRRWTFSSAAAHGGIATTSPCSSPSSTRPGGWSVHPGSGSSPRS